MDSFCCLQSSPWLSWYCLVIGGGVLSNIRLQFLRLLGSRKNFLSSAVTAGNTDTDSGSSKAASQKSNPASSETRRAGSDGTFRNSGHYESWMYPKYLQNNGSGISTISSLLFSKRKCPEPICLIAASANTRKCRDNQDHLRCADITAGLSESGTAARARKL